jgi:hypothetical protein
LNEEIHQADGKTRRVNARHRSRRRNIRAASAVSA